VSLPQLHLHQFPAYAPELNPDEHVWTQIKQALANSTPTNIDDLEAGVAQKLLRLRHSAHLLWSCIDASALPWA